MTLAAQDASGRVEQLIVLTERLTEMLAAETRAFAAPRPQDPAPGSAQTIPLAHIYRHESARVRSDPSLVASAPLDKRRRLIAATRTFEAVLARHGRSLKAAKTITEGLVRAIAQEVATQRAGPAAYGPRARAPTGDASAITLNRRA